MAEPVRPDDDLTTRLEACPPPAGGRHPSEVSRGQLEFLCARIAALSDLLRTAHWNSSTQLAARLLLADVALVTGQFRAETNAVAESTDAILTSLSDVLDSKPSARTKG